MRLLLDSQILVWANVNPQRLSIATRSAIRDPDNKVLVSVASAWELWVKHAKKPIIPMLDKGPATFLAAITESGIDLLEISLEHAAAAAALPRHHRDPFDRMLIAQAMVEQLTLVTADSEFARYDGLNLLAG